MSNVDQFKAAVTQAGAEAIRIERGSGRAERLVITTRGGLITREVPLEGDLAKDIQNATSAARQIVASAKVLTAEPARKLIGRTAGATATVRARPGHWRPI
jgi:hypothetical protein